MARLSSLDQRNFSTFKSEAGKKQGSISFRNIAEETEIWRTACPSQTRQEYSGVEVFIQEVCTRVMQLIVGGLSSAFTMHPAGGR